MSFSYEVRNKRIERRDGAGKCFCAEVCAINEDGKVLERAPICEPLALPHVDEAYIQRRVDAYRRQLEERWADEEGTDLDLDAIS